VAPTDAAIILRSSLRSIVGWLEGYLEKIPFNDREKINGAACGGAGFSSCCVSGFFWQKVRGGPGSSHWVREAGEVLIRMGKIREMGLRDGLGSGLGGSGWDREERRIFGGDASIPGIDAFVLVFGISRPSLVALQSPSS